MRTYIVTGGAGFIGSRLAKRLLEDGHRVYILDDLSTGFERNIPAGAAFFKVDVNDVGLLRDLDLPQRVDALFHFAGQSSGEASFDDPLRDIDVNYRATYNVLELAAKKEVGRFIYASSMSVYGEIEQSHRGVSEDHPALPISYYGCNKLASEKLITVFARQANIKPTILRFFSIYGPGQNMRNLKQGIVSIYISYLMKNRPVIVKGALNRFRDLTYIDDLTDLLIKCEDSKDTFHQVLNVGTGIKTTVEDLLKAILTAFGKKDFEKWVRVVGNTPGDIMGCTADITKLEKALNWKPQYRIAEGLAKMKLWLDETKGLWERP